MIVISKNDFGGSMNITFMIGNGFDLACGLHTSYKDFLKYYLSIPNPNAQVEKLKGIIQRESDTWADAEYALGMCTTDFSDITEFRKAFDDFVMNLSIFLSIEEQQFTARVNLEGTMPEFIDGLLYFDSFLNEHETHYIEDYFKKTHDDFRMFNFLIFNYTNIFESFINKSGGVGSNLGTSLPSIGIEFSNAIGSLHYVHGKRNNPPLVLGVNDRSQVANSEFHGNQKFLQTISKPQANERIRNVVLERCLAILKESTVICIYGMSIGQTDNYWWEEIRKWLIEDDIHHLLVFYWDTACIKESVGSFTDTEEAFMEYLKIRLSFGQEEFSKHIRQIHLAVNVDLFGVCGTVSPQLKPTKFKVRNTE